MKYQFYYEKVSLQEDGTVDVVAEYELDGVTFSREADVATVSAGHRILREWRKEFRTSLSLANIPQEPVAEEQAAA